MYIRKILYTIVAIGLLLMGGFAFYIYNVMFAVNTNFNEDFKHIYIKTGSDYEDLTYQLNDYLLDTSTFTVLAERKN